MFAALLSTLRRCPPLIWPAFLCGLLAVTCSAAQETTTGTLRGVVLDAVTRQPIARVLVWSPGGGPSVLTDNSGAFSFPGVPLGTCMVRYRRPGYFDPLTGEPSASETVSLSADDTQQTLLLEPAASLHGLLQLPDGDSASGMRVELYEAHAIDGWRRWQFASATTAQSDGSFTFGELAPGSYLVHSSGSMDPVPYGTTPGMRWGYTPVWAPGSSDIRSASVYSLQGGGIAEADLQIQRQRFYPVSVDASGAPFGCQVSGNGFTHWQIQSRNREDGLLTTELPSGNYMLRCGANFDRAAPGDNFGELPLHIEDAPIEGAQITMNATPVPPVNVEVDAETADSSDSGAVSAPRLSRLMLLDADTPESAPRRESVEYTDADSSVHLTGGLPPGRYWVSATASGGYVAALSGGGADLFEQPLTVVSGIAPTLSATLRTDYGSLTVTREGSLQTTRCVLHLIPLSAGGTEQTVMMDASNTASNLSDVVPGDYLIFATESRKNIAYREPGVLQQLSGVRVTVAPAGTASATLSTLATPPLSAMGPP